MLVDSSVTWGSLALTPQLLPGENFATFVSRSAQFLGMPPTWVIAVLSERAQRRTPKTSFITWDSLQMASATLERLGTHEELAASDIRRYGDACWQGLSEDDLLATSVSQRRRLGIVESSRVCPLCIAERPVWKTEWRVPWVFSCERHHCYLVSNCDQCGEHVMTRPLDVLSLKTCSGRTETGYCRRLIGGMPVVMIEGGHILATQAAIRSNLPPNDQDPTFFKDLAAIATLVLLFDAPYSPTSDPLLAQALESVVRDAIPDGNRDVYPMRWRRPPDGSAEWAAVASIATQHMLNDDALVRLGEHLVAIADPESVLNLVLTAFTTGRSFSGRARLVASCAVRAVEASLTPAARRYRLSGDSSLLRLQRGG